MTSNSATFTTKKKKLLLPRSKQYPAPSSDVKPLPRGLHLLVLQLLQAGAAAGHVGRGSGSLQEGHGQPGQHRLQLRTGFCFWGGGEGPGRLDRTQAQGAAEIVTLSKEIPNWESTVILEGIKKNKWHDTIYHYLRQHNLTLTLI